MIFIIVLVIVAVLILVLASQKPDDFVVSRSIDVKAKPEKIFPLVNDFHEWAKWSPYEHMDANLKKTFSGSPKGVGAIYQYEGEKTGMGIMEITQIQEPNQIEANLSFIKPMKAENIAKFHFVDNDGSTKVTWSMSGKYGFMSKVVSIFLDLDKLVGKDFEKGLENIKGIVETA
jgi:carbon monoxide dehydrogenase subunit G